MVVFPTSMELLLAEAGTHEVLLKSRAASATAFA